MCVKIECVFISFFFLLSVEEGTVVVEATSVTATCGVLPVLADAAVTHLNMATKLPGLSEGGSLHAQKERKKEVLSVGKKTHVRCMCKL